MTHDHKLPLTSADITAELLEKLRAIAPQVFTEGGVDFDKLKTTLGENIMPKEERYGLNWAGKSAAFRHVQTPSVGTLLPQPEQSVNFDSSENLIIEGDNLEVLKLLQKSYHNQIKMIYIDPPYNTGNEFIYPDNFHEGLDDYLKYTGQLNAEGQAQSSNRDTNGRFHSNWLNMMYPRLFLARNLLRDDGVIFVSIDDNEVHNLRMLMNEVFGEENFIGNIAWESKTKSQNTKTSYNKLQPKIEYVWLYTKNNCRRFTLKTIGKKEYPETDEKGHFRFHRIEQMSAEGVRGRESMIFPIFGVSPPISKQWQIGLETVTEFEQRGDLLLLNNQPTLKMRPEDERSEVTEPFWGFLPKEIGTAESAKKELSDVMEDTKHGFETVKPLEFIKKFIFHATHEDSIVLDFFAGSGTTAHAVLDLNQQDGGNRKFILVQLPEPLTSPLSVPAGTPSTTPSLRATPSKEGEYQGGWGESEAIGSAGASPASLPPMHTIADITRERVRRVIKKLTDTAENSNSTTDKHAYSLLPPPAGEGWGGGDGSHLGFKAFKLASSNFKIWNADTTSTEAEAIAKQLRLYADNVTHERTQQDILYELLLKAGLPLSASVKQVEVAGKPVYAIADGALLLCLENDINQTVLRGMMALKPQQMICLDRAFGGNDPLKTNTVLEANSHKITFKTV